MRKIKDIMIPILNLEMRVEEEYTRENPHKLGEIGRRVYARIEKQLLQDHAGKYVFIIPGSFCTDKKHKIIVVPAAPTEELEQVVWRDIQREYPGAVFYQRYIGNPRNNPYLEGV